MDEQSRVAVDAIRRLKAPREERRRSDGQSGAPGGRSERTGVEAVQDQLPGREAPDGWTGQDR